MNTYFRPELILSQLVGTKISLLPEFIILIACIAFVFKDSIIKFIMDKYNSKKCSIALHCRVFSSGNCDFEKFYRQVVVYLINHGYINKLQSSHYYINSYMADMFADDIKFNIDNLSFCYYVKTQAHGDAANNMKQINIILISSENIDDIKKFIDKCVDEYENNIIDCLYTASYEDDGGRPLILEDKKNKLINYQTFDNLLYCKHAEYIKKELDTLANAENYKNGKRRKLSFLTVGPPGTGKTFVAQAMALYSRKHLIRVQLCKIKKYKDITNLFGQVILLGLTAIKSSQAIIFFDEIDKFINTKSNKDTSTNTDKTSSAELDPIEVLNLIMESMDTIGIYDGQIYIAAANSIEGLHPALLRPGRFKVLNFGLLTLEDLIDYGMKISDECDIKLPKEYDNKFSHAEVFCKQFVSLEEYLEHLKALYETSLLK